MTNSPTACPEPDGQERTPDGRTAHRLMIDEGGACPWCLATDEEGS